MAKPRWLRFSLRTLFVVVTIFGVWLGWNLKIVASGIDCLTTSIFSRLGAGEADPDIKSRQERKYPGDWECIRIPWTRRVLGDHRTLRLRSQILATSKLIAEIEAAFPEAELHGTYWDEYVRKSCRTFRDSLYKPADVRKQNEGNVFKTGLTDKYHHTSLSSSPH